jgi:hypothetical protein
VVGVLTDHYFAKREVNLPPSGGSRGAKFSSKGAPISSQFSPDASSSAQSRKSSNPVNPDSDNEKVQSSMFNVRFVFLALESARAPLRY